MDGKRKGFLVALVIGLVAAPALALVASGLLGGEAVADEPTTTTVAAVAPVTAPPATSTTTTATPPADLETACTIEGADLVAGEAAGMLSDLQQAALDALRPICRSEGFSLEAAPTAQIAAPVTTAPAPATTTTTAPAAQYDDGGSPAQYADHADDGGGDDEGGD
jgi:hypothetical protein